MGDVVALFLFSVYAVGEGVSALKLHLCPVVSRNDGLLILDYADALVKHRIAHVDVVEKAVFTVGVALVFKGVTDCH